MGTRWMTVDIMAVGPQTLKNHRILFLRAEVRTANADLDGIVIEIGKHISDMEEARLEGDLPQNMLFSYSTILSNLISRGETLLNE